MKVAVTYAEAKKQVLTEVDIEEGSTVEAAITRSGILQKFPHIRLDQNKIGIFGKLVNLDQILADGERVEIYRPALGTPPKANRGAKDAATSTGDDEPQSGQSAKGKARTTAAKMKTASKENRVDHP